MKNIIPTPAEVGKEGLIVLGGLVLAALVLNQFPKLRDYVAGSSITLRDQQGRVLW